MRNQHVAQKLHQNVLFLKRSILESYNQFVIKGKILLVIESTVNYKSKLVFEALSLLQLYHML